MPTCNQCGSLFQYDASRQNKMDWTDEKKPHVCKIPSPAPLKPEEKNVGGGVRNYYEEKEKKIEELARAKIAALEHIATAIEKLAESWAATK